MSNVTVDGMPWQGTRVSPGMRPRPVSDALAATTSLDVLLLDNRDSFTFNLAQSFAELGASVEVVDADLVTAEQVIDARERGLGPHLVVIGPGPRGPADLPRLVALVEGLDGNVPLFGVCLGLQVLVRARGGVVGRARAAMHGKRSALRHDDVGCLRGLPQSLPVMRYHSLVATVVPSSLTVTAVDDDGQPMALLDAGRNVEAVQFHPESIGTAGGMQMLHAVLVRAGVHVDGVVPRQGAVPPPAEPFDFRYGAHAPVGQPR